VRWRIAIALVAVWFVASLIIVPRSVNSRATPKRENMTGVWRFTGLDGQGRPAFPLCTVEIAQHGDRADIDARAIGDAWTCTGRGVVEGNVLRFNWAGEVKGWRGTARFVLDENDVLRGTYRIDGPRSEDLACIGERE
jgi:hypothetical protein